MNTRTYRVTTYRDAVRTVIAAQFLVVLAITVEILGGADYPAIPPGLLIPLGVGLLLCWRPYLVGVLVGFAFGFWLAVGAVLTPEMSDHLASGEALLTTGAVLQLLGIVAMITTGGLALYARRRAAVRR